MPKIIIGTNTVFKKRLLGTLDLTDSEKVLLPKGTELDVREVAPDRNKHFLVQMAAPLVALDDKSSFQQGFIFGEHIRVISQAFIIRDTFLKKRIAGTDELSNSEKVFLSKDTEFGVLKVSPDRNKHLYLQLTSPITAIDGKTSFQEAYIFNEHIQIETVEFNQVIKLPVPYFSQLNNDPTIFGPGWRQCNTTSNAMLADYLLGGELSKRAKEQGFPEPESIYMRIVGKYGDTTDHNAQTRALMDLGIESYFSYTLSGRDLLLSLRAKIPIVVGFAYKGSGHICVIVGHDPIQKQWLVHDPYGTRLGSSDSYDIGIGGNYDLYSYDVIQQIFWDQGSEAGWGRIITSVNGKSTGLPLGL
ncbi:MAG: C39 family peptidase [Synechococcales bacterium]|nr:C39 family peptidase [Synechococcales bacterium]